MKKYICLMSLSIFNVLAQEPIIKLDKGQQAPPAISLNDGDRLKTTEELESAQVRSSLGCVPIDVAGTGLIISQSGRYCLTRNVTISSTTVSAITITASNVELDLNGFTITGPGSGTGIGILVSGNLTNIRIRNGVIESMGSHGIHISNTPINVVIERFQIRINGGSGIQIDDGVNLRIQDIQLDANGVSGIKFFGGDAIQVIDCQSSNHSTAGEAGYHVEGITHEMLFQNCMSSRDIQGFDLDRARTTVVDSCMAHNTTGGPGIVIGGSALEVTVRNCEIHFGGGIGIDVAGNFIVLEGNNIIQNADGINLRTTGDGPDIQVINNRILNNSIGIDVLVNDCVIKNNIISESASGGIRIGQTTPSSITITKCEVINNVISNNTSDGIAVVNVLGAGFIAIMDNQIFGNTAYGINDTSTDGTRRYYRNFANQNNGAASGYDYTNNIPFVRNPSASDPSFGNSQDFVINVGVPQP